MFKDDLKRARVRARLSLQEAADKSGLSYQQINHMELGTRKPTLENITKLLKAIPLSQRVLLRLFEEDYTRVALWILTLGGWPYG